MAKTSLEILSKCGSSAPFLQTVVDTVLQIIQYAEDVKRNRKDAVELALSAAEIIQALFDATEGLDENDLDGRFKRDLARFHEDLSSIVVTMKNLTKTRVWLRLLQKDTHFDEISRHRRALQQAIVVFQIRDGISKRVLAMRHHEEVMDNLKTLTNLVSQKFPSDSSLPRATDTLPRQRQSPRNCNTDIERKTKVVGLKSDLNLDVDILVARK